MSWTDAPYYMTSRAICQLPGDSFADLYSVSAALLDMLHCCSLVYLCALYMRIAPAVWHLSYSQQQKTGFVQEPAYLW